LLSWFSYRLTRLLHVEALSLPRLSRTAVPFYGIGIPEHDPGIPLLDSQENQDNRVSVAH
jgi:hypothetical protein